MRSKVEETAGKQGRKDVMEAMRKFKAYEGETEGRQTAIPKYMFYQIQWL